MSSTRKAILVVFCLGVVVIVAYVGTRSGGTPQAQAPNILLVIFDTTRADHIGAYGWRYGRTPTVDRLAEQGVRFEHAYATVPLTLPSHSSLLTGIYPFYLDVRDNSHFSLSEEARTLPEMLKDQGYQTAAVVASFVLDRQFGLSQGFDTYRDEMPELEEYDQFAIPERDAQSVVDDSLAWLDRVDKKKPFFLWSHFYDPHHPYTTPADFPFYQNHPYDMEIAYADYHLQRLVERIETASPNGRPTLIVFAGDHGEGLGEYGEETHGYFVYDSTLRVPLIIKLPGGENAGKVVDASVSLVDVLPTILDLAGRTGPAEDEIHGRSLVGLIRDDPAKAEEFKHRPLYFESCMAKYDYGWAPLSGVRMGPAKFIQSPIPELYLMDQNEREIEANNQYRRQTDLANELAGRLLDALGERLKQPPLSGTVDHVEAKTIQKLASLGYLTGPTAEEKTEFGPEDDVKTRLGLYNLLLRGSGALGAGKIALGTRLLLDALEQDPLNPRAIGLLGSAVVDHPQQAAAALPALEAAGRSTDLDPETRARILGQCGEVYLRQKDVSRAMAFLEEAIGIVPRDPVLLDRLSVAQVCAGRLQDAVETTRRAIECSGDLGTLRVRLGILLFCQGDFDEAVRTWTALIEDDTSPMTPWEIASRSLRDAAMASAGEAFGGLLERPGLPDPIRVVVLAAVGRSHYEAGRYDAALPLIEEACRLMPEGDGEGPLWHAKTLLHLGRDEEALPLLKTAYAEEPDSMPVAVELAGVYRRLGRQAESVETLSAFYEAHKDNPGAANNLAWALAERAEGQADLDRALSLAEYAVQRGRAIAAFHDTLGWIHIKRGETESAVFVLRSAAELAPQNAGVQYHLGLAMKLDHRPDEAREAFRKAVELAPMPGPEWYEEAVSEAGSGAEGR